jgi:hypothetical protein
LRAAASRSRSHQNGAIAGIDKKNFIICPSKQEAVFCTILL